MKAAFVLFLVAMLILPAMATVRIMVSRERRRQRDEAAARDRPTDQG